MRQCQMSDINIGLTLIIMCDVCYGRLELYTVDYNNGHKQYIELLGLYRVMCSPLKVMCSVLYSYAHKLVMCGDLR